MLNSIKSYFDSLVFNGISSERQKILLQLSDYLRSKLQQNTPINLIFICTHNSRRSHFGQVWATIAADFYDIQTIECFSGGTEASSCNIRTVDALKRAGFGIIKKDESENPKYEIRFSDKKSPILAFSKVFDEEPNPISGFCAIMTCGDAEDNCPSIIGAEKRFAITYIDPKISDESPSEVTTYDQRCRQIASEMKYVFSEIGKI